MQDLFAKARAMHMAKSGPGAAMPNVQGAPAVPKAPEMQTMAAGATKPPNIAGMTKKLGLDHMKLDSDPIVARTQLMQQLQQKFGPGYMTHPGVSELLQNFSGQSQQAVRHQANELDSQSARTVKTLMGG